MKIQSIHTDFPIMQTHSIKEMGSVYNQSLLIYRQKPSGWIDAYYTLIGPLLIAMLLRGDADNIGFGKKNIIRFALPVAILYILFSSFLQNSSVEEIVIDRDKKVIVKQHSKLKYPYEVQKIDETIPFNAIHAVEYLTCHLDNNKRGYELNLLLNDQKRCNIFAHRDPTMIIDAKSIANMVNKPLIEANCTLPKHL
jgi:uncharacterized Tic20 family protein